MKIEQTTRNCYNAALDLWKSKDSIVTRNDQIAVQRYLRAAAVGSAMYGRDDGLPRCRPARNACEAVLINDHLALLVHILAIALELVPSVSCAVGRPTG